MARTLFEALTAEGLEVSLKKTTWIASSPAVEAALKKQSKGEATQVSSVAKDLWRCQRRWAREAHAGAGKTFAQRSDQGYQAPSPSCGTASPIGFVSPKWAASRQLSGGTRGLGLSPKQLRGIRTQAAQAGRRQQLGSVDVVFSLGEGNCCDPLRR